MNNSPKQSPTNIPESGLMGYAMLVVSAGILGIAMIGGAKIMYDILSHDSNTGLFAAAIVLGIVYILGWTAAMAGVRMFKNPILPILINLFMIVILIGLCILYGEIMQRLYKQEYGLGQFTKYSLVMLAGISAMVGLHFIIEDHDLRPFAIPLLIFCAIHLGVIVYRYVFVGSEKSYYIIGDFGFLFGMAIISILMLVHVGLLNPIRTRSSNIFDGKATKIYPRE